MGGPVLSKTIRPMKTMYLMARRSVWILESFFSCGKAGTRRRSRSKAGIQTAHPATFANVGGDTLRRSRLPFPPRSSTTSCLIRAACRTGSSGNGIDAGIADLFRDVIPGLVGIEEPFRLGMKRSDQLTGSIESGWNVDVVCLVINGHSVQSRCFESRRSIVVRVTPRKWVRSLSHLSLPC